MADRKNVPASHRPIADENGRTADVTYSPNHLEKIKAMARAGKPVKLPPGVTLDDDTTATK